MKKLLFILPAVLLFAAGCSSSQNTSTNVQPTPPVVQTTPVQSQPANDTSNWKTYASTTYGFQINYPVDWNLKEYGQKDNYFIIFSNFLALAPTAPSSNFQIQIRDLGTSADGQAELKNRQSQINSNITSLSGVAVSHMTVGGVPALRLLNADPVPTLREDNIMLLKGNTIFNIAEQVNLPTSASSTAESLNMMDEILATFKFTN